MASATANLTKIQRNRHSVLFVDAEFKSQGLELDQDHPDRFDEPKMNGQVGGVALHVGVTAFYVGHQFWIRLTFEIFDHRMFGQLQGIVVKSKSVMVVL
jgi:hypothetical protein